LLDAGKILDNAIEIIAKTAFKEILGYDYVNTGRTYPNQDYSPVLCHQYADALEKLMTKGMPDTSGIIMRWGTMALSAGYDALSKKEIYDLMVLSAKAGCNPDVLVSVLDYKRGTTPLILELTHMYGYNLLGKGSAYSSYDAYGNYCIYTIIETIIEHGALLDPVYQENDSHFADNYSPLSHAISDKSEDLVRLFVSKGAKMDQPQVRKYYQWAPDNIRQILLDAGFKPE
jgi:hypothetical protein